jgi:hypothetical protein
MSSAAGFTQDAPVSMTKIVIKDKQLNRVANYNHRLSNAL